MKKEKKYVIYSSRIEDVDLNVAEEWLISLGNDVPTDDEILESAIDNNHTWFNDEKCNLDIECDTKLIAFGKLGFWDGNRNGYAIKSRKNLNAMFDFCSGSGYSDIDYYVQDGDVHLDLTHHDGVHKMVIRRMSKRYSEETITNMLKQYIDEELAFEDIMKCSVSVAKDVARVYGW